MQDYPKLNTTGQESPAPRERKVNTFRSISKSQAPNNKQIQITKIPNSEVSYSAFKTRYTSMHSIDHLDL
jgi:hypothetical protein